MCKWISLFAVLLVFSGCSVARKVLPHEYSMREIDKDLSWGQYKQAAAKLEKCASSPKNPDHGLCEQRLQSLNVSGKKEIGWALAEQRRVADERKRQEDEKRAATERIAHLRASQNPWDKYILFSELSARAIEPLDPDEPSRVAKEAFAGFGECAKSTDPSCMGMYGELILRGMESLDPKSKQEARRKALYWLNLSARYGYEPARRALVAEGEVIPSPDLAMERLQKEANNIAKETAVSQERAAREQAARDYEMLRESRRQTEQLIWANLFPKMVSCSTNSVGSYAYTTCW